MVQHIEIEDLSLGRNSVTSRPRDSQSQWINCLMPTVYSRHFATGTLLQMLWWIILN